ncbi:MAG TPA: serine protease [Bdellovibrionota bacterium]|nr:serine protease [Bdellovibrionota bacterium]
MSLVETFEVISPSIVALASRLVPKIEGVNPVFPWIIGTGFVVDSRGIIATNDHVIQELVKLPKHPTKGPAAMALVPVRTKDERGDAMGYVMTEIRAHWSLTEFTAPGPYYGQMNPDFGFIQLDACELPPLKLSTEGDALQVGMPVATAGYPLGTSAITVFGQVNQAMPFLRHGIVSSMFPFPTKHPHGFTIDVMSQHGASGSPIFRTDTPEVVGILYGGLPNHKGESTNITLGVPSEILAFGLDALFKSQKIEFEGVPTFAQVFKDADKSGDLKWETITVKREIPKAGT